MILQLTYAIAYMQLLFAIYVRPLMKAKGPKGQEENEW